MKKTIVLLVMCMPTLMNAQTDINYKGVKFEEGLSWEQIKAKAKEENKYIFIDCYATWCGPCKHMDKNIYPNEQVGANMNNKFISVKVQFDKTSRDNDYVRSWYNDADALNQQYHIIGYPSYLFFSPDGKIVHRYMGMTNFPDQFIEIAKAAMDPSKQYYTLLDGYLSGKKDVAIMQQLARATKTAGNKELAEQIVNDYLSSIAQQQLLSKENIGFMSEFIESPKVKEIVQNYKTNYLDKLDEAFLCTKENLDFINRFSFLVNSKDRFFKLFYSQPEKANAIINDTSFSQHFAWSVIRREEILDKLYKEGKAITSEPDWKKIRSNLVQKYGNRYATKLTPDQIAFYKSTNNWKETCRIFEVKMKEYPPQKGGTAFTLQVGGLLFGDEITLNENAWYIFLWCNDKIIMEKALRWTELSIELAQTKPNLQFLDTRANLLYKLGRVDEAIAQEQQAIEADIANAKKEGRDKGDLVDEFMEVINKMKKGIPTWEVK